MTPGIIFIRTYTYLGYVFINRNLVTYSIKEEKSRFNNIHIAINTIF